jgi:hypothetical protein
MMQAGWGDGVGQHVSNTTCPTCKRRGMATVGAASSLTFSHPDYYCRLWIYARSTQLYHWVRGLGLPGPHRRSGIPPCPEGITAGTALLQHRVSKQYPAVYSIFNPVQLYLGLTPKQYRLPDMKRIPVGENEPRAGR